MKGVTLSVTLSVTLILLLGDRDPSYLLLVG